MRIFNNVLGALAVSAMIGLATNTAVGANYPPASACTISIEKARGLLMERPYAEIRDALGCDGVLVKREVLSKELTREVYQWRGEASLHATFEGLFYNGALHGKDIRWIAVSSDVPASDEFASQPAPYIPPDP